MTKHQWHVMSRLIVIGLFALSGVTFAIAETGLFDKAKNYAYRTCNKRNVRNEQAMLCYLWSQSEQDTEESFRPLVAYDANMNELGAVREMSLFERDNLLVMVNGANISHVAGFLGVFVDVVYPGDNCTSGAYVLHNEFASGPLTDYLVTDTLGQRFFLPESQQPETLTLMSRLGYDTATKQWECVNDSPYVHQGWKLSPSDIDLPPNPISLPLRYGVTH